MLPVSYHWKLQKQTLSVTYSVFFSLSETELTGTVKAEDRLLITPNPHTPTHTHVLWTRPCRTPGEQTAQLCSDCCWFRRAVVGALPPLQKQAPREPAGQLQHSFVESKTSYSRKNCFHFSRSEEICALAGVPPLRWQGEPVSQTPLAGVEARGQR